MTIGISRAALDFPNDTPHTKVNSRTSTSKNTVFLGCGAPGFLSALVLAFICCQVLVLGSRGVVCWMPCLWTWNFGVAQAMADRCHSCEAAFFGGPCVHLFVPGVLLVPGTTSAFCFLSFVLRGNRRGGQRWNLQTQLHHKPASRPCMGVHLCMCWGFC